MGRAGVPRFPASLAGAARAAGDRRENKTVVGSDSAPAGVWQYKARWRSSMGYLVMALLLITTLLALAAVGVGSSIGLWLGVLGAGWLAWAFGKPLFNGAWIVRIGPRGISGHWLKGRTVPWRDVRDIGVETLKGNTTLVLHLDAQAAESLQKTRRWLHGRKPERRIPLNGLRQDEVAEVLLAAQSTFAERAGAHAAAAAQARQEEARVEAEFTQELERGTSLTWALYLLVALNVGAWLWNVAGGVDAMRPASPDLFRRGAISAWAVAREHEYWRLLAGTFLHGGLMHLAMNMLGLWSAGKLLNRLYGNAQFLLIYLLSALAGASASLHFGAQVAVSVGASGAVFGVLGALLVAVRRHRESLPKSLVKQILTSEGVFLLYALANGFTRQGIDNAAHVGGLLAGAAMGWVLSGVVAHTVKGARLPRAAGIAAAVLAVVAAMVATTPSPRVDHRSLFVASEQLQQVVPRLQAAQAALQKDVQAAKAGRLAEAQMVHALQTVHLPALRALYAELGRVPRAQGDPRAEATADMLALTGKTVEAMELQVRMYGAEATAADREKAALLERDIKLISQRLQERIAALSAKKAR